MNDAVTVILIKPNCEILMQLRDDGNGKIIEYPNMWSFPTGGMDDGESCIETAVREMNEEFELTLDPADLRLIWTYSHDKTKNDHVFAIRVRADVNPIQHEGADMKWMQLSEIKELPLAFEKHRVIPYVEKYLESEGLSSSA